MRKSTLRYCFGGALLIEQTLSAEVWSGDGRREGMDIKLGNSCGICMIGMLFTGLVEGVGGELKWLSGCEIWIFCLETGGGYLELAGSSQIGSSFAIGISMI